MATTAPRTSGEEVEKQISSHHECVEKGSVKEAAAADYSGAVAKTDPAEIKLVRKLDLFIMVRAHHLSQPFFIRSKADTRRSPAYSLAHVLAQLLGPECDHAS